MPSCPHSCNVQYNAAAELRTLVGSFRVVFLFCALWACLSFVSFLSFLSLPFVSIFCQLAGRPGAGSAGCVVSSGCGLFRRGSQLARRVLFELLCCCGSAVAPLSILSLCKISLSLSALPSPL